MSWDPHSPHFIQKSGLHLCQNQQLLTPGSCWDQNHTWFFPLHFKQWFIFSKTFTTEVFWTEKETFWKYFAGLIFLLAQCTQPYGLVHSTAPVGDCQQELQFVQLGTSTSAHPWASLDLLSPKPTHNTWFWSSFTVGSFRMRNQTEREMLSNKSTKVRLQVCCAQISISHRYIWSSNNQHLQKENKNDNFRTKMIWSLLWSCLNAVVKTQRNSQVQYDKRFSFSFSPSHHFHVTTDKLK